MDMRQRRSRRDGNDHAERDRQHCRDQRRSPRLGRTKDVHQPQHGDASRRPKGRVRDVQIVKGIQRRERSRHHVVRAQQQCAEHRQRLRLLLRRRIDAAAIRIQPADHRVGPADRQQQCRHRQHEPQRRVPRVHEAQSQHVQPTRPPIAVQHRSGVIPGQLARTIPMNQHVFNSETQHWSAGRGRSDQGTGNRSRPNAVRDDCGNVTRSVRVPTFDLSSSTRLRG